MPRCDVATKLNTASERVQTIGCAAGQITARRSLKCMASVRSASVLVQMWRATQARRLDYSIDNTASSDAMSSWARSRLVGKVALCMAVPPWRNRQRASRLAMREVRASASGNKPDRLAPQVVVVQRLNAQMQSWSSLRTRIWSYIAGSSGALRRRVDSKVRRLGQARAS